MKKLLICLLAAVLMLAMTVIVSAEAGAAEETEAPAPAEEAAAAPETEAEKEQKSMRVVIVPSEEDLPDGYEVDDGWGIEIELSADEDWSKNLTELLSQYAGDGYVYFFAEQDVPEGYTVYYTMASSEYTDGIVIVVKNVKEGEPPVYELPRTGGSGTTYYTVIGTMFLVAAAAGAILLRKRRDVR